MKRCLLFESGYRYVIDGGKDRRELLMSVSFSSDCVCCFELVRESTMNDVLPGDRVFEESFFDTSLSIGRISVITRKPKTLPQYLRIYVARCLTTIYERSSSPLELTIPIYRSVHSKLDILDALLYGVYTLALY